MEHANIDRGQAVRHDIPEPIAGVIGGLVAGAAYLLAQVSFTAAARPGSAAEPLQRIAAILMGPDAAPPPTDFNFTIFGMAMIIHIGLSMVFGRVVSALAWQLPAGAAVAVGMLVGVGLYGLNFGVIAPQIFPWFADSLQWVTIADHALFGAVAGAVCVGLRRPRAGGVA